MDSQVPSDTVGVDIIKRSHDFEFKLSTTFWSISGNRYFEILPENDRTLLNGAKFQVL